MVKERLVSPHGILELAERGQPIRHKIVKCGLGILPRDRPVKRIQLAGVGVESSANQVKNLFVSPRRAEMTAASGRDSGPFAPKVWRFSES